MALLVSISSLCAMAWGTMVPAHNFTLGLSRFEETNPFLSTRSFYPWVRGSGTNYLKIARVGYTPSPPTHYWDAAFFPGYPFCAWCVSWLTGISLEWTLAGVSFGACLGAAALLPSYLSGASWMTQQDRYRWVVWYFLWPVALFFYAAYSESLFLLAVLGFLICLFRRTESALWLAAFFAGLAGWTRIVGVALVMVLAYHVFLTERRRTLGLPRILVLISLSLWGTAAAMAYQCLVTGDVLAFVHARSTYALRETLPWWRRFLSMASLEPLWRPGWFFEGAEFFYGTKCWFCRYSWLNPIVVYGFALLFLVAYWKKLASKEELLLAWLLWAIPYFGQAQENILLANARYNLFAFPAFHVMIYYFRYWPKWLIVGVYFCCGGLLLFFSYGFGAQCLIW